MLWAPQWGTKVSPQPVVSRPAGCSSFDSAASSHQQEAQVPVKLCLLTHQCLHGSAPPYLIRYFTPVSSIVGRSHLCSAVMGTLFVPRSRTLTIGPRAFAISSPSAWNSLPVDLRDPGLSLWTFRRRLKTYLFNPPGYLSS